MSIRSKQINVVNKELKDFYYCDNCGMEITGSISEFTYRNGSRKIIDSETVEMAIPFHFCKECADKILKDIK